MPRDPQVVYPPPLDGPLPTTPAPAGSDGLARLTPQQVLLVAGAVAVVAAGTASLDLAGWALPSGLALATAVGSLVCGRRGLPASEETLAAACVVLVVVGDHRSDPARTATVLAVLALVFLALGRLARAAVTWTSPPATGCSPAAAWTCSRRS